MDQDNPENAGQATGLRVKKARLKKLAIFFAVFLAVDQFISLSVDVASSWSDYNFREIYKNTKESEDFKRLGQTRECTTEFLPPYEVGRCFSAEGSSDYASLKVTLSNSILFFTVAKLNYEIQREKQNSLMLSVRGIDGPIRYIKNRKNEKSCFY